MVALQSRLQDLIEKADSGRSGLYADIFPTAVHGFLSDICEMLCSRRNRLFRPSITKTKPNHIFRGRLYPGREGECTLPAISAMQRIRTSSNV